MKMVVFSGKKHMGVQNGIKQILLNKLLMVDILLQVIHVPIMAMLLAFIPTLLIFPIFGLSRLTV
jgi:hypothetical protein